MKYREKKISQLYIDFQNDAIQTEVLNITSNLIISIYQPCDEQTRIKLLEYYFTCNKANKRQIQTK